MSKKVIIGPGENNYETVDLTADEISEIETRMTANANALAAQKTNAESGNQKLLDLGLTQAEVTAMTGYKPE
tara:strand:- start:1386 stop:1601 length:216 start_codon:yes stop_codon:yes gene_type:complete